MNYNRKIKLNKNKKNVGTNIKTEGSELEQVK